MLAVIERLQATDPPALAELSAFQLRNAVLPAEAALALRLENGVPAREPRTRSAHRILPVGPDEGLLVRTYTPLAGREPFPVIVYFHGGGWVLADLDTYEPSARALAARTGAVVVSVAYRLAPEHPFPTAHEDAFAAYRWVTENAAALGGDPGRIATAGESAGGNLAVAVALMAKQRDVPLPVHVLSVYPIADGDVQSSSYAEFAQALPLDRPLMEWFFDRYAPGWRTEEPELIALVDADLAGLPPTTIVNAAIDPLLSDGEELAERLRDAGVEVVREVFPGVTHEFFGMSALLAQAERAQELAASRLRDAFGTRRGIQPVEAGASADAGAARIDVRQDPELGPYLTDAEGRALDLFAADEAGPSTCYGACADAWPPLLTRGEPWVADARLRIDLAGTIRRRDGSMQVTYGGWPLYHFVRDGSPGQTAGQGVEGFGARWHLVSPEGQALGEGGG
jgi:acetyl esterase/lipase